MVSQRGSGLRTWLIQRVSAVYLAGFIVVFALRLVAASPDGFEAWRHWVGQPSVSVPAALFFVALVGHAWVGMRDVLMDYVHPPGVRLLLLAIVGLFLVGCGLWALQILVAVAS